MSGEPDSYIPALRYRSLTSLYDPLIRLTTREDRSKRMLLRGAAIGAGQRVLDLGCGTATLALLIKREHLAATVTGIDADPQILRRAAAKVAASGLEVTLERGLATALPYPDGSFERVLSSLVFHHLTRENKRRALREAWRVLVPGGELHIADWGRAANIPLRAAFLLVQLLDGFRTTADNVRGRLPRLMSAAGFHEVEETARIATIYGSLSLYRGRKSS